MKILLVLVALILVTVIFTGCVQPAPGTPGYHDPYGNTPSTPERRWWGQERPRSNLDIDKFLWRWRGLNE